MSKLLALLLAFCVSALPQTTFAPTTLGREVAIPSHLPDGAEFRLTPKELVRYGNQLFSANWTEQEGGGRPLTKGTGKPLVDPTRPLTGTSSFNRVSGPDANSCAGCHNMPFGIPGGSGDFVTNVFVLGQRFDFATFDASDPVPTRGGRDESGRPVTQFSIANQRATTGMFGGGYLEMLARQITADLQQLRDSLAPGQSVELRSKGIYYGVLARRPDGSWDLSRVEGIPMKSLELTDRGPSLIIRPWHQAGVVVSLREFSNNAFNHHHGIQSTERFGIDQDPDGDGVVNEMTRADVTAVTIAQAAMAVPGRVIPNDPAVEAAVLKGEKLFETIGCASCHIPSLRLDRGGWIFTEPNPYNPEGNLQVGQAQTLAIDLNSTELPLPRLPFQPLGGFVEVPAYTDFKLHDLCDGPDDPNFDPLNMQLAPGAEGFFAGNGFFLTKRLWDVANQPPYFHHGQYTTMRQAILAHGGEGAAARAAFKRLDTDGQAAIIEFLKTLQVLPPGTPHRIVDENYRKKAWPPVQGLVE
jgi:cytochrome c peroxidase